MTGSSFQHAKRGSMTPQRALRIFQTRDGRCYCPANNIDREHYGCGRKLKPADDWRVEHGIALENGGTDDDAAFYMLDSTTTSIRAEIELRHIDAGVPASKAEKVAKVSPAYREHLQKAADAKRNANVLRARMDYLRMRERRQDRREWQAMSERKMARSST